ncbi:glycosyltransferase [Lacimicrobium sp. SS2-24]|uniref:glycosyltransferase n=1 Tax=Lacimicrobium sp. SS2-24 TaxID=2005569 RepID=UPI000B4A73A2|nr:glycosyltransferase [Lacimicrobium sp. SS2-24]
MKDVVIIIPTHNDSERLRKCLRAISAQTYPLEAIRVIVVDNNSSENIESVVRDFEFCEYQFESKPGSYSARNKALREIRDKSCFVGFTDSDCIPDVNWVSAAVALLEKQPLLTLGGRVDVFPLQPERPNIAELYEQLRGFPQQEYVEKSHFAVTANVFTTTEVIEKNGRFNDELFSGGDLEWGNRLSQRGLKLLYADDVIVRHPARSSISQLLKKIRRTVGGAYRQKNRLHQCEKLFTLQGILRGCLPPLRAIPAMKRFGSQVSVLMKINLFLLMTFLKYYQTTYRLLYKLRLITTDERF